MPELVVLTQKATQPEAELELTELERDSSFAEIREIIRSWRNEREMDESFEEEHALTIDTDEDIAR
jgi:hypothetical protein